MHLLFGRWHTFCLLIVPLCLAAFYVAASGMILVTECAGVPLDFTVWRPRGNQMMEMMERRRCGGVGAS
ncbi:hypothetical protein QC764_0082440 [Podospora pseudoanserina]|uniref:Uncharacterized protein n=1 Tax=Podospora pseudoanserina TaxID=2609844 RepID=A0ABR0I665_9PEZI|nr:hypothetical protein QC764_0082440 [Podospora pseudoanserina]